MQGVTGERHSFDTVGDPLMAGRGPAPDTQRIRRGAPARGEWTPSPDGGWQHPIPEPPPGLTAHSVSVWEDWFRSWWAGNWSTDDLPVLRLTIRLYDRVMRGDVKRMGELRQWLDSMGITPKGRQDRRWQAPPPPRPMSALDRIRAQRQERVGRSGHLRGPVQRPSARERQAMLDEDERPSAVDILLSAGEAAQRPSAKERLRRIQEQESASDRLARIDIDRRRIDG